MHDMLTRSRHHSSAHPRQMLHSSTRRAIARDKQRSRHNATWASPASKPWLNRDGVQLNFVDVVFRCADPDSYAALRVFVFPHEKGQPVLWQADEAVGDPVALTRAVRRATEYSARTTYSSAFAPAIIPAGAREQAAE